jgi:hypothetical protein
MSEKRPDWEPLPDSRPSLCCFLFAAVVACGITSSLATAGDGLENLIDQLVNVTFNNT